MKNQDTNLFNTVSAPAVGITGAFALTAFGAGSAEALVAVDPIDTMEFTELGETVDNSDFTFDLNGDGQSDFKISDFGPTGYIKGYKNDQTDGRIFREKIGPKDVIQEFAEGDSVTGMSGKTGPFAKTHIDFQKGFPLPNVGDTTYIGLALTDLGTNETNYGWLEITRGSLILGTLGYQTVAGTAAPIPAASAPIPVPASLALLATGAAGLGFVGRRRRKAA
jgi:hypothetical protein